MQKIVIVSKVAFGARAMVFGLDGTTNPFKKSRSANLRQVLQKQLAENHLDYTVEVDNFTGDIQQMHKDGADLILLSPYVAKAFALNEAEKEYCRVLREEEYLNGETGRLVEFLKSRNA